MFGIKKLIKTTYFKFLWRKHNSHNYTSANMLFNENQVCVGKKTYGELNINLGTNPERRVIIGNYCSIAPNVQFIINPHNYKFFSSWGWQIYEYNERWYGWENVQAVMVQDILI